MVAELRDDPMIVGSGVSIQFAVLPFRPGSSTWMTSYCLPTPNAIWPVHVQNGLLESCDTTHLPGSFQ